MKLDRNMPMRFSHAFLVGFMLILSGTGCNPGCEEIYYEPGELVPDFHPLYFPHSLQEQDHGLGISPEVFIDFSSGMQWAFKDSSAKAIFDLFLNSLEVQGINFKEIAAEGISPIPVTDPVEMQTVIKDGSRYTKDYAPLDQALKEIVARNTESLMISDFELYRKVEREIFTAWARTEFGIWLEAGNTLDFYITDFSEGEDGQEKHLFFVFFSPANPESEQTSLLTQFQNFLESSLEGHKLKKKNEYSHFKVSNSVFYLEQDYPALNAGGANEYLAVDPTSYVNQGINNGKAPGFEYLDVFLSWRDAVSYIREGYDPNTGEPVEGGLPYLNRLYLHTQQNSFFKLEKLSLQVYDIYYDLNRYRDYRNCLDNPPVEDIDDSGKPILDETGQTLFKCPGPHGCYDGKGNLIATPFSPDELKEVKDVFVLDWVTNSSPHNQKRDTEISIKIHDRFIGTGLQNDRPNILRLDLVLEEVYVDGSNPALSSLRWISKSGKLNSGLYDSLLGALYDANPKGKTIYSFYIQTPGNDYSE